MKKHWQPELIELEPEIPELELLDEARSISELANRFYSPFKNAYLMDFVESNVSESQHNNAEPFHENLSAGKNTYVYDAHTYHTKVPPQAIEHLIEHYTEPGDIVLDPFCGSGMTGVAALRKQRKSVVSDLSPAATFIAFNFMTPVEGDRYMQAVEKILASLKQEEMLLYGTHCRNCNTLVPVEYMVWCYGLTCEYCDKEFVLWDVARDERESVRESKILKEFDCPHCESRLQKRKLQRTKLYPVQIGYKCCGSGLSESRDVPDDYDLKSLNSADKLDHPWYPKTKLPNGVNTRQAIQHGLESVDVFYTKRNLWVVSKLWDIARRWPDEDVGLKLMFTVTSLYQRVTKLSEFRFWGGSGNMANYNVPMIFNEQNVLKVFHRKAKTIKYYLDTWESSPSTDFCISTPKRHRFSQHCR